MHWPLQAIWQAVAPTLEGFTLEALPEIDSTNSELMRRVRGGAVKVPCLEPILLVAEEQTTGRGRLGRSWQSRRGDSLTFSLGMPLSPTNWSGLSLAVGISIADALDPPPPGGDGVQIGLKWPNDLWLRDAHNARKLAGILVETASIGQCRYVVIGVGINIHPLVLPASSVSANPINAALPAGCLQEITPGMDAAQALLRIVAPLVQAVKAFEQFGFAPFQARFAQRDVLSGRQVVLSDGTHGTAHGAGENGALLVHTAAGMKEITSSEISVRPVCADRVLVAGSAC